MSYFSECYNKTLGKSHLKKKGFILAQNLRVQFITEGKDGDWSLRRPFSLHLGKQREMKAGFHLCLCVLFNVGHRAHPVEWGHSKLEWAFLPAPRNSTDTLRGFLPKSFYILSS